MLIAIAAALVLQGDSAFRAIVPAGAELELVATGFRFTEGPTWTRDGALIFSDIPGDALFRMRGGSLEPLRKPANQPNGNTIDRPGRLVTCEHGSRRVTRTERDGKVTVLAERFEGKRLNSPNDVVVRSDGSVFFTDPPYGIRPEQAELGFNGVFQILPSGELRLLARDFARPNGIALSPDQRTLYVSDTARRHIRAFDLLSEGHVMGGRVFATLSGTKPGSADGLRVDTRGRVYSTGPGGIHVFTPEGALLGVIAVPESPTNCAFGEKDRRTLFITAGRSVYKIRLHATGL